ncbi:hypothetical protein RU639_013603 [Aspergillus parasiticus]
MASRSRQQGSEQEDQRDAISDLSVVFSDDESDRDPDCDSKDSDDENKPGEDTFDDRGQLPPESYLAQAVNLNVSHPRHLL